jgi:hypothetical protein
MELLAPSPHHARPLARSTEGRSTGASDDAASDRAGASGASSTFLIMRVRRRSAAGHARLLALSGAAAEGRSTSGGAASGRTGASGATQRVLRTHCGVAESESGFIGRRRRLSRALYPPLATDAGSCKMISKPHK